MPLTDPIGDMLTRMRNAQHARRAECRVSHSKLKLGIAQLLKREGYLANVDLEGSAPKQTIVMTFVPGRTLTVSRESKPGRRLYRGTAEIKPVLHGFGIGILSTNMGLLTDREAKEKKVGGELLCTVA
jgi:small subunit ribosomal protein S8